MVRPPAGQHDTGRSGDRSRSGGGRRQVGRAGCQMVSATKKTALDPMEESRRNVQEEIGKHLAAPPTFSTHQVAVDGNPAWRRAVHRFAKKEPALIRGRARVVAGPTGAGYGDINIAQHRIRRLFSRQFFCQRKNCHVAGRQWNDGWSLRPCRAASMLLERSA